MEFRRGDAIEDIVDKHLIEAVMRIAKDRHRQQHKDKEFELEFTEEMHGQEKPPAAGAAPERDTAGSEERREAGQGRGGQGKGYAMAEGEGSSSSYTHEHTVKPQIKGWICCSACGWSQKVSDLLGYDAEPGKERKGKADYAGDDTKEKRGYHGQGSSTYGEGKARNPH